MSSLSGTVVEVPSTGQDQGKGREKYLLKEVVQLADWIKGVQKEDSEVSVIRLEKYVMKLSMQ